MTASFSHSSSLLHNLPEQYRGHTHLLHDGSISELVREREVDDPCSRQSRTEGGKKLNVHIWAAKEKDAAQIIHLSSSKAVKFCFSEVVLDQSVIWVERDKEPASLQSTSSSRSLRRPWDNEHTRVLGRGRGREQWSVWYKCQATGLG